MKWYPPNRTHPIRLEPKPWTGRERRRKSLPEITATIVAKSAYGVKIKDDGDWLNWSRVEFRGEPFNTEVQKGDRVQITYAESDSGKVFITTIDKVTGGTVGDPIAAAIADQPFPPDEDFPPDEPQAASAPVLDTNRLIVRQVTAKCAVEALGEYPATPEAQEKWDGKLLYQMSTLCASPGYDPPHR